MLPGRRHFAAAGAALLVWTSAPRLLAQTPPPAPPPPTTTKPAAAKPVFVAPRAISTPGADYPAGASGDAVVVLELHLGDDGRVGTATSVTGDEPFASAAIAAALTWRFEPATRDGKPIASKIRFQVTFTAPAPATTPAGPTEPTEPTEPTKPTKPTGSSTSAAATGTSSAEAKPAIEAAKPDGPTDLEVRGSKLAPAVTSFSRAEVRELPGAFGDPFRAVEALPGVTPIASGLPFFYVRGSPPGNVGYFIDGVRVPYLYHVGLGPSVIHPGMVDRVDLYPGGYPARFGRYAGGIVSGETTEPRPALHGEANLRVFDVGALVETGFADGKGTVLLGGRFSYTAAVLSLIAKDVSLGYRDYQARVTYDFTPNDRVTLFSFGSYDLLGQTTNGTMNVLFGSEFYRVDLRYDHAFDKTSAVRVAVTLGWDQTRIADQRNARDRMLGTRVEYHRTLGDRVVLRSGADATVDTFDATRPRYVDPDNPSTQQFTDLFPSRSDLAGGVWADLVWTPGPAVEITPGVRADFFQSNGVTAYAIDPRIAARFKVSERVKIVHAYGLAHQAPSFIVPVPGLVPASLSGGLQSTFQASAGVEAALPGDVTATATVFNNAFFNMTDAIGTAAAGGDPGALTDRRSGGRAFGFELFVRRRLSRNLGGFLSYTLSRSTRTLNGETFPATFDRTHVATAALAYNLGRDWRAGSRIVFYTGAPTLIETHGLTAPPPTLSPNRDPSFYRLDVRLEKRWHYGETRWISFVFELMNATFHKETISGTAIGPVSIPSIGLEGGI